MPATDISDPAWDAALSLLGWVVDRCAAFGAAPTRYFVAPGRAPAWDNCCGADDGSEGQAWVQIREVVPTTDPTSAASRHAIRPHLYAVGLTVGVLRCAATQDDTGRAPTPERLVSEAAKVARDRALVRDAILYDWRAERDPGEVLLGPWRALGPQGGCVGGATELTVMVPACRPTPIPDQ